MTRCLFSFFLTMKTNLIILPFICISLLPYSCKKHAGSKADEPHSYAAALASDVQNLEKEKGKQKRNGKGSISPLRIEFTRTNSKQKEIKFSRTGYEVSYNPDWRIPNWVAYELTDYEASAQGKRGEGFESDPDVKGKKAQPADYSGSGYDRGHMAPAGDMKWSGKAMRESFYLSNICPQHHDLNTGLWNDLEVALRERAKKWGKVYIVCGPIVGKNPRTVGKNKVVVPDSFFKVVCWRYKDKYEGKAFVFKNAPAKGRFHDYSCTIDEVESITGHDFFFLIPDSQENIMEATDVPGRWY